MSPPRRTWDYRLVANFGDVAISLGPVLVTGVGAWVALHYGRATARDQTLAEGQRARMERHYVERDHRQGHYHDALTLLWRFRDASMCRPRFPIPELRTWRQAWRREASGVTLFGSAECRAAVAELDRVLQDIHQHWYETYGMPEETYVPQKPLLDTDGALFASLAQAQTVLEEAMRSDIGSAQGSATSHAKGSDA